jgi:5-amino-6-(5-phosphoribosylamino)uracil reductase
MSDRPYTLMSCSVSLDGYLGDRTPRLALSNEADFDRVDEVRASCDAIMVGAVTVRTDNPRLLVRSRARREERTARGLPPSPKKITVTSRADLDARSNFFTTGEAEKLVYTPSPRVADARARLGPAATIVDGGRRVRMRWLTEDLGDRGVERLMVEGGGIVHTQFLADDLVDELHLVVAPFFVGDSNAPRFVRDGHFPWNAHRRAPLAEAGPRSGPGSPRWGPGAGGAPDRADGVRVVPHHMRYRRRPRPGRTPRRGTRSASRTSAPGTSSRTTTCAWATTAP